MATAVKLHKKNKSKIVQNSISLEFQVNSKYASWFYLILSPVLITFMGVITYFSSKNYNFQFDDLANIVKYFEIRNITLSKIFFANSRWISYWLNSNYYAYSKFDPTIYRLGNIFFHLLTGVLVFTLLWLILSRIKNNNFLRTYAYQIATFSSALFILHPVQTQTVSYVIQGQLEGLACLFIILSSIIFLQSQYTKNSFHKLLLYVTLFAVLILSCGTKEIAIISPALLILLDWFFISDASFKNFKKRIFLHALIILTVFSIYIYFLKPQFFSSLLTFSMEAHNNIGNVLTESPHDKILPLHYFISEFKVLLHYAIIFIWPFNISVDYDWKMVSNFFAPDCILPFSIIIICLYFIYKRLQKNKTDFISFAALWFLVSLLPRVSIIPSSELLADYKTYTASFGILSILGYLLFILFLKIQNYLEPKIKTNNNIVIIILSLISFSAISYLTYSRNKVWSSAENFWGNIIKNAPLKARGYNNYGVALSENGKYEIAIPLFQKAIDMDSKYPDPCNNIAVAYSALGQIDKAIEGMKLALKIQPFSPEAHNNIGSFYRLKKDFSNAEINCLKAVALRKTYGKARYNLGLIYYEVGQKDKAYDYFKSCCLNADMDNEVGFAAYASISAELGKFNELEFACQKLIELNPGHYSYYLQLGAAYLGQHKLDQAYNLFIKLHSQNPQDFKVAFNLGQTLLNMGRLEEALSMFIKTSGIPNCPESIHYQIAQCRKAIDDKNIAKK